MFKVIPVIDLYNGTVVHAKHGQREYYRPIQSQLTPSSQPIDIVDALLAVYPFEQLYIADLNAIIDANYEQKPLLKHIQETFPQLDIWLDQGVRRHADLHTNHPAMFTPVIGTENITQIYDYKEIKDSHEHICLSLDFLPDGYKGPRTLKENSTHWPENVIVMSLSNVGGNQGVNQSLLEQCLAIRSTQHLYAAGGVRDHSDLHLLKQMKIDGALVATALHNQKITTKDIIAMMQ